MDQASLHFWKTLDIGRLQLLHLKGNSGLVTHNSFIAVVNFAIFFMHLKNVPRSNLDTF